MTFLSVSWSNGDTVTEVKLDQMIENDEHVRAESEYKILYSDVSGIQRITSLATPTFNVATGSGVSGAGAKYEADIDISAMSDGLNTLGISLSGGSHSLKFVKTPDIQRITYFVTLATEYYDESNNLHTAKNITVIGHRSSEGWTT